MKPQQYSDLINHIKDGGTLWVNGFREITNDNPNITASDILLESDFISLEKYKLENKRLYEIGQRHFVRYIWKK